MFYRLIPWTKRSFFPPYASANLEKKPQTGGADIFLACCIALQPAYVKKGNGFKWLHVYTVVGGYTMAGEMLCLALGIKKMGFLTSSQSVQGWASSHFSSLVSRTSLQSLRLWCRLYGAVFSEKALCAHDVCWHWLNISMKPVWWWKVEWKEKQEERGNTSVAKTNGAVEFKNMIKLGWR